MILNPRLPVISLRYEQAMEEKEKHDDMVQQRIKKFNAHNGQDLYEMILYTYVNHPAAKNPLLTCLKRIEYFH